MKLRPILTVGLLLIATLNAAAQEEKSLSLHDAKTYALTHNLSIKSAELAISAAQKNVYATMSKGLPQADASVDFTHFFNYEIEFSMGGADAFEVSGIDYSLFDAGDYEMVKFFQQAFGGSSEPIVMGSTLSGKLQLTQLLFSGQYLVGVSMAKLAKQMSELQLEKSKTDIEESVANVYSGILVLEQSVQVMESTIENLEETKVRTRAMVTAGMAEATDTTQIKMAVNNLLNNKKQLERTISFNYSMLKFLLGINQKTKLILTDTIANYIDEQNISTLLLQEFVVEQVEDYKLIESQELLAEKSINLEKMSYTPTAAAFYNYNHKFLSSGFDMNPNHIVGVAVQVPLFSGGGRNFKLQESKIKFAQVQYAKTMLAEQLAIKEQQARFDLSSNYENYLLQKENVELSVELYEKVRQKFEYGVASSYELTQANNDYMQAQSNYLTAFMQLVQSKNALEKLL